MLPLHVFPVAYGIRNMSKEKIWKNLYESKKWRKRKVRDKTCSQCSRDKRTIPDMTPGTVAQIMAQSRKFDAANITVGDVEF